MPGQILVEPPAVIVGTVGEVVFETTVAADVALQEPDVTVTVRLPEVVTVMDCVVAPVDQRFPVVLLELSVTLPPGQKESGPLALMVGVAMEVDTVTTTAAEVAVVPFLVTFTL